MNHPSSTSSSCTPPTAPPTALVHSAEPTLVRLRTRLWWLTALCLLLALGLVITSFRRQGVEISIGFKEGHGLKAGDALRYRGIDIGRVSRIALSPDLAGVQVNIVVQPGSELVAVEGSQFWVQRARLSLSQVSGIETVLGAKYVGVLPANRTSAAAIRGRGDSASHDRRRRHQRHSLRLRQAWKWARRCGIAASRLAK